MVVVFVFIFLGTTSQVLITLSFFANTDPNPNPRNSKTTVDNEWQCEDSAWVSEQFPWSSESLALYQTAPSIEIIIRRSEKVKKLKVISTLWSSTNECENKHNHHLRLPCARQQTTKDEKTKPYTTNWRTVNTWTGLWLKLATSGKYMYHLWKTYFYILRIVIFASRVLFFVSFTRRPAAPTSDWSVVWI